MQNTDVLIAGAGPTGLMLALWLGELGIRLRIADPKSGPTRETRAIAVQARTLEFYDQLGLGQEALAHGRPFGRINLFARGEQRAAVSLSGLGDDLTPHPNLYILTQDQNEAMLVSRLEALGVSVEWQTEVTDPVQDGNGVIATLRRGDHAESVRAQYIAGCDGAHSAVRRAVGAALSGGAYGQRFYVADADLGGKVREGDLNLCLDNDRFLAFFPMPQAGRYRIVGQLPAGATDHADFETVRPEVEAHGLARVQTVRWFSTYQVHHLVADQFRVGRAFLLGDAAHLHSPVGGQGMNTGLGDAVNLAWKLAQAVRSKSQAVLDSYEPERRPFALALVNTTDRVFAGVVAPSASARWIRTVAIPAVLPALTRWKAVRRLLFLTISQTRIHYPDSSLSAGKAGKVSGGDRLPWIPQAEGSNFGALKSLDWQLHVYGTPGPELLTWCMQRDLPLKVFPFTPPAHRAGLAEDALYVVRPDGYVGLAAPRFERVSLDAYAGRWLPRAPITKKFTQREAVLAG